MSLLYAIILGIVQGLTEFLPVSSSGHLVLLNKYFKIENNFLIISIFLHVATLLAVIIYFWRDIKYLISHPFCDMTKKLVISFVPTAIIVVLTKKYIDGAYGGSMLPICFMITAILLLVCDFFSKARPNYAESHNISTKTALVMGAVQGLAVAPGISRSGSTICSGLLMGENRENVARFSFLMSIPVILASLLYELIFESGGDVFSGSLVLPLIVSFVCALLVGLVSIKIMIKIVKKAKYYYFSIYLAILAIAICFI